MQQFLEPLHAQLAFRAQLSVLRGEQQAGDATRPAAGPLVSPGIQQQPAGAGAASVYAQAQPVHAASPGSSAAPITPASTPSAASLSSGISRLCRRPASSCPTSSRNEGLPAAT